MNKQEPNTVQDSQTAGQNYSQIARSNPTLVNPG